MSARRVQWQRVAGEAALIIASVFVAIVLEGMWQERVQAADAHSALVQLLQELKQDQADLERVAARQVEIDKQYTDLRRWLADPATLPADEFHETLENISVDNMTLYVRQSAWANMVAGGHLQLIDDPMLVNHLADLYENRVARLDLNNNNYDVELFTAMREVGTSIWDGDNRKLLTNDPFAISVFRGQLRYLHIIWNLWYIDFMSQYAIALDALILEVESYLKSHNYESQ
jgi:hypothetical protein